jgi:hemerythrin-like domain-containing protein
MSEQNPHDIDHPLDDFSNCHVGIIDNFERLRRLPQLLASDTGNAEAKEIAANCTKFFKDVVLMHHEEEEDELFNAVTLAAHDDTELDEATAIIDRLVAEHRELESLWQQIEADMKRIGKGKSADLNTAVVSELADKYLAHARYEEEAFLPLSAKILSKNDQSALGLSLHMRHSSPQVIGYI